MVWLPMTSSGLGHRLECVQGLCEFALLACQLFCKARPNPSTSSLHSLWLFIHGRYVVNLSRLQLDCNFLIGLDFNFRKSKIRACAIMSESYRNTRTACRQFSPLDMLHCRVWVVMLASTVTLVNESWKFAGSATKPLLSFEDLVIWCNFCSLVD